MRSTASAACIVRQIVDQGGDNALALKGNQGTLHDDVRLFLDRSGLRKNHCSTCGNRRSWPIETRVATVSTGIDWLQQDHQWPGLKAFGKIVRTRKTGIKITTETAYYLLSAPMSAERFGEVAKAHWAVENSLHWMLDVTMNEDQARNRLDRGPNNLAVLRHMALNILNPQKSKISNRRKIKRAGWNNAFLADLLAQI